MSEATVTLACDFDATRRNVEDDVASGLIDPEAEMVPVRVALMLDGKPAGEHLIELPSVGIFTFGQEAA